MPARWARAWVSAGVLPSHGRSAPLDARRRGVATRAPLHVVADLDGDFVSIVPRNPNHQRCLLLAPQLDEGQEKRKTRYGEGGRGGLVGRLKRRWRRRRREEQGHRARPGALLENCPFLFLPRRKTTDSPRCPRCTSPLCLRCNERTKWRPLSPSLSSSPLPPPPPTTPTPRALAACAIRRAPRAARRARPYVFRPRAFATRFHRGIEDQGKEKGKRTRPIEYVMYFPSFSSCNLPYLLNKTNGVVVPAAQEKFISRLHDHLLYMYI